ncbi:MAG: GTPase Era [Ignavibacteria bacterium]|nr:GTPase Era [Ignavibacteria bacterium]
MIIKSGYVTIIGKPNVGKSTLMNSLIGSKLSIVTNKPQTTRKKILGILSHENYQIIFLDTPGILHPEYMLQESMMQFVNRSVADADVLLFIIDVESDKDGTKLIADTTVNKILKKRKKKILLLNKIDLSNQLTVEKIISNISEKNIFDKIIPISASNGFNLSSIINAIIEFLPEHPKYFPDDQLSDENERFFVSEIIREKIFEQYRDEIPYSTEVIIEEFKEREKGKNFIKAQIVIERETQKPIILGNKGDAIKILGKAARKSVEEFLQREVYLELFVKVKEKWRTNKILLKNYGYNPDDK